MKRFLSVALCLALLAGFFTAAHAEGDSPLAFRNGEFKILVLSDTQDDHHPAADMLNLISRSIEAEKPDLIIFTGDLVEDNRFGISFADDEPLREGVVVRNDAEKTYDNVVKASDAVFSVFQKSGIPFAIAQGNNDHKVDMTNAQWLELYSRYSNNLTCDMSEDEEGRIDYNLMINTSGGEPAFNLWLMDTGRHGISEDSISWYREKSAEITRDNGGEPVPAFVFQHIQVPDVGNLFEECSPFDEGARGKGGKFYRLNKDISRGIPFYAWAPCEPSEEFTAWKEQGDIIGAYFGHQHVEGFTGTVDGIELGFTYGSEFAKTGPYGYRVITLKEDDIRNYENDVYTYEGSVKNGDWRFEKENGRGYTEYANPVMKYLSYAKNFAWSVVTTIIALFADT